MEILVKNILKKNVKNRKQLAGLKRIWAKKHKKGMPRNSDIIKTYKELLRQKEIKRNKSFENLLRLKKVRSLSGIVPIAVLTKPYPCPGKCIYCPTQRKMPKSYLEDEPAVMRAQMANFDPYKQVGLRLEQLKATGHSTEKIELIVMGGTFTALPFSYQKRFIKGCFDAVNNSASKFLKKAQEKNEKAKNRIIGITLETRPDEINIKTCKQFRELGCTRVEIGVQSIYEKILKKVKRGHGIRAVIQATKLLKDSGFKVCYHLMPNLPGSNPELDLKMFKTIFKDSNFKPDMIKIYPCIVTYQAELYDWYKNGGFKPYTNKELIKLLLKIKKIVPPWVRINRLGRDIPVVNIAAGSKLSNIREVVQENMKKQGLKCQCIRCREVKAKELGIKNYELRITKYEASEGKEYFLEFVDKNYTLYALLRLRMPFLSRHSEFIATASRRIPRRFAAGMSRSSSEAGVAMQAHEETASALRCGVFISESLKNASIVRELHTYGLSLPLKTTDKKAAQHKGLGRELLREAEEITRETGLKKICVISGVGAREYYRKLGYKLKDTYMVKYL